MSEYLFAALGLGILLVGGDILVRGAVGLSLKLGIPALIVSLTIVAFGTSAPELLISVQAIREGSPGIAMGNVVGSNVANIFLVLGMPALLAGLHSSGFKVRRSYITLVGASIFFIAICFLGPITYVHGLALLALLAAVLWDQVRSARKSRAIVADDLDEASEDQRIWKILLFLAGGLISLPLGADLLVDSSVSIARRFGLSEAVIGLTLIAIGTSLPELATTVMAAFRKQAEVALGNVIGSNLFNILAIIGLASLTGSIPVERNFLVFDLWFMLFATLCLAPFVFAERDMTKRWGTAYMLAYAIYLWLVVMMGHVA